MPFVLGDPTQTIPEIHVGDIGTPFVSTIYNQDSEIVNLATNIGLTFRFKSPSNVSTDKTAVFYTNGTDGKMKYILEDGLFTESGSWQYQGIIEFASGTWYTNITVFTVYPSISEPVVP